MLQCRGRRSPSTPCDIAAAAAKDVRRFVQRQPRNVQHLKKFQQQSQTMLANIRSRRTEYLKDATCFLKTTCLQNALKAFLDTSPVTRNDGNLRPHTIRSMTRKPVSPESRSQVFELSFAASLYSHSLGPPSGPLLRLAGHRRTGVPDWVGLSSMSALKNLWQHRHVALAAA